ncbi:MAG TPA: myxococcus cysteine-rich repeat containing protein [Candidatus Binatia bacterium]|jgi:cysteine-rich repeat protein
MSKIHHSGLRASYLRLPALAGFGAAFVLAIAPAALAAQPKHCTVHFNVTNATTLGALQFHTDYTAVGAKGDFANSCTWAAGGLDSSSVNADASTMDAAFANPSGFTGPGEVAHCTFVMPDSTQADPTSGNFAVTVTDSSDTSSPPNDPASPAPTMSATADACTTGASVCGNGVLEPGEQCDDGNLVEGDGCDSSCNPSDCPSAAPTGCLVSTVAGKSKIAFKNDPAATDDTKDSGSWGWKSGKAATFLDPTTGTGKTYSWCVYEDGSLLYGATVPAGTGSGWATAGATGFGIKGAVFQIKVKGSDTDGKSSLSVKAKSKTGDFHAPDLSKLTGVTLSDLVTDDGVTQSCYQTTAGTATVKTTSWSAAGNP